MLWLYAIVAAERAIPERLTGVLDSPVSTVRYDEIAAVTSEMSDVPSANVEEIEAHARVLDALLAGGAVVPMRFGMGAPNAQALTRDVLRRNRRQFVRLLDELEGRVEMNIKAAVDEDALLPQAITAPSVQKAKRSAGQDSFEGRLAVGEAVVQELAVLGAEAADRLVSGLAPRAVRVARLPVADPLVLNTSFLIERDVVDDFRKSLDDAAGAQAGLADVRCTGPLPAYSFTHTGRGAGET